jgi:hypothetical protein
MRPKQFYFASLALFLMAVSFPVQAMLLYGHHWSETSAIFSKMTIFNWLVVISFLAGSYFYFHASRTIVYLAPLILGLVALNNYWVGQFAGDFSMLETSLATLAVGVVFTPLALPSSRVVLQDPKRRWWRRSKRHNRRVSATLNPYVGEMLHVQTFDISQSGAFVCLSQDQTETPKVGDTVRVSFNVNSMKKIRCEAVVVRISEAKGHYPRGMGLKFTQMERPFEKSFERFLNSNETLQ